MNFWQWLYRVLWGVFVGMALLASGFLFVPKWREYNEYHRRRQEISAAIGEQEEMLKTLKSHQERFHRDPRFVEKLAHEMGKAKPGEFIYKFREDDPLDSMLTP
jgi:hypothetical protein